jgi:AcrR family transcriptional regulator
MHAMIYDAVLDLVGGGETLSSLSLVTIARETGVSRNAIYRRWRTKEDLFCDVVRSMQQSLPEPTEQSARENLNVLLDVALERVDVRNAQQMERAIVSEAQNFPKLYEAYLEEIVAPLDRAMKTAIRRGKESREIRADVDEDLLCDVLFASLDARTHGPRTSDVASLRRRMIDLVFDGASPQ